MKFSDTMICLSSKDYLRAGTVILILFCTYPFVFNRVFLLPSIPILMIVTVLFASIKGVCGGARLQKSLVIIGIFQGFSFFISSLVHFDFLYLKQIVYILWAFSLIILINSIGLKSFLYLFNRIILIVAFLGTFSFLLSLITGNVPVFEYKALDDRDFGRVFFTFTNTNIGSFIRYAGIFDEPGAMAYWGMFSLLTNKLYVNDSAIELPLIVFLCFTFSMAFYIQLVIYVILFMNEGLPIGKKALLLSILFLLVVWIISIIPQDSILYQFTISRFKINESTGLLNGDNRSDLMNLAKSYFIDNPIFGIGPSRFGSLEYMSDNPFETLAKDGIFGTFFLYLPLIAVVKKGIKYRQLFYASIILLVGYMQRPFHIQIIHFVFLYIVYLISLEYGNNMYAPKNENVR